MLGSVDEELEYNNNNIDSNGLSSEATGSVIEGASLLNSQSLSSLEQSTSLERVRGVSVSVSYSQNNYNLKIFIYYSQSHMYLFPSWCSSFPCFQTQNEFQSINNAGAAAGGLDGGGSTMSAIPL